MRAKGVGQYVKTPPSNDESPVPPGIQNAYIRLHPVTRDRLALLRRPLVDSEGNLVAFESFDRLVRRLIEERRADGTSGGQSGRTDP